MGRLLSFLPILVTKFKFNNFEMILEETAVKTLNISVIEKDVGPRWQNRPKHSIPSPLMGPLFYCDTTVTLE